MALLGMYFAASLASAFSVARRKGLRFLPILPIVFATYQFSYALGFLLALLVRPAACDSPNSRRKAATAPTR
jgi:hypothetical protein